MSVITFVDAVAIVITRLRAALPALTFVHDVPTTRPPIFIRIYRVGGPKTNLVVDGATLAIESWAPDSATASTNAALVRAQLNALPEQIGQTVQIYRVDEFSGPAELPDPTSASRRVTWTSVVHIRGGST